MRTVPLATIVLLALQGCSSDTASLASRLPANNEIDSWKVSEGPTVIASEAALYNQIDGGAPKYIDRGWLRGAYASYVQGAATIDVAIHDMGNPDHAQSIFQYNYPTSPVQIGDSPNAIVDMGAYAAEAYAGQYYMQVSSDERSDSALDYVRRFVVATMSRCD
jgi:hypothetical protein